MAIKKIGELLVERGLITPLQLQVALEEQNTTGSLLGEILVEKSMISAEQLVDVVAERLKMPRVTLDSLIIDPKVIQTVPVELARRYTLIPVLQVGKALTVAMADPLNVIAVDELAYSTNLEIRRAIATPASIRSAIERYYSVQDRLRSVLGEYSGQKAAKVDITPLGPVANEQAEAPVVQLVNIVISKAVRNGASDVHIEPNEHALRVRYRVHGKMREEVSPPKALQNEIISRIKIAAGLDVSEKRVPQDGRFSVEVDNVIVDLRISTLPTIHGEKIVVRILDPRKLALGLPQLGFTDALLDEWRDVIRAPEGLILISGPTSSGKTSTLYASLQEINSVERNIITVEDPVEYSLSLINQVQTNDKAGLTFAACLRSILRQNPDVIMVGEMRDSETARMGVRAALTGHLVFSTIHANDSASSVTRMVDIGVESFLVASSLKAALAQRLARANCPDCLEEYAPPAGLINLAGLPSGITYMKSGGCNSCRMTGHKGMTGVYEFLPIDHTIREMIVSGKSDSQIKEYARTQGMKTLFEYGLDKLRQGRITLEELLRVALPSRTGQRQDQPEMMEMVR